MMNRTFLKPVVLMVYLANTSITSKKIYEKYGIEELKKRRKDWP